MATSRRTAIAVSAALAVCLSGGLGGGLGGAPATAQTAPAAPALAVGSAYAYESVTSYGAVGDGRTDDTAALQRAFDTAPAGTTLVLPAGSTFAHSDVLRLRRADLRLVGPGALLATREERSGLWVEADRVTVDHVTLRITGTTRRWEAWEQMRLRVTGVRGTVLRDVTVDGSAAAGVYVGNGASDFLLDRVTVRGTRADGIHMTGGAHHGRVLSPTVVGSGDDGVAVVSYGRDGAPCSDITVSSPTVLGTTWGRGVSVVGGTDVTVTDVHVERSSAAGVYVASEGAPWFSAAPVRVRVTGGEVLEANTSTTVDHGAVVVLAGGVPRPEDVVISGLRVAGTRASASRSVGVITYGTPPTGVVLQDLTVVGGPRASYSGNTASGWVARGWTVDGRAVPDRSS